MKNAFKQDFSFEEFSMSISKNLYPIILKFQNDLIINLGGAEWALAPLNKKDPKSER